MSTATSDFEAWQREQLSQIETALSSWIPADAPAGLGQVMRYATLQGGKRLRPLLVLAAAQAVQGHPEAAMRAACAVELIHAYSLVHDDMPCMDNDVLRRGQPTVHVQFGQAQALLAGDAMQALAFEWLTPAPDVVSAPLQATLCRQLAQAAGHAGMAGGQAIDLTSVGKPLTLSQLEQMHALKTGALLQASVMMGAACGTASPSTVQALHQFGAALGLAFQVIDDVLDVTADAATLGKTTGKDALHDKPTFVSLLGLDSAKRYAMDSMQRGLDALSTAELPSHATWQLTHLAHGVIHRDN